MRGEDGTMTNRTHLDHYRALRLLCALVGLPATLCACSAGPEIVTASLPNDYRLRHPIAIEEAKPVDRPFRRSWTRRPVRVTTHRRHGAGPGLGSRGNRRDRGRCAGGHAERTGCGDGFPGSKELAGGRRRAPKRNHDASLPSGRSPNIPADQVELSKDCSGCRPLRSVAGRCRAQYFGQGLQREQAVSQFRLRKPAQHLAAMVDNPADLVQPRPESPAYTARRTAGFEKYRKGDPNRDQLFRRRKSQTQRHRQMTRHVSQDQDSKEPAEVTAAADDYNRAGASRFGAGVLRDHGNRACRAIGRRRPPPRQGPSHG